MTRPLEEILLPAAAALEEAGAIVRECAVSAEEQVLEIERPALAGSGKRLRPAVALLSGAACGGLVGDHARLAAAAELIHMATLAHDDVIDRASLRRGRPTVNASWGNAVAVLFGDYLLSRAFAVLCGMRDASAVAGMARMTREVCEGEILQLRRRYDIEMSEKDYLRAVAMKTASLFSACGRLGAALTGVPEVVRERLGRFGEAFGTAYQIVDDCLDLSGAEGSKDRLKDLEGGRVTLPLIKGLGRLDGPARDALARSFREGDAKRCARELISSGAVADSMRDAEALMASARRELSALPESDASRSLIELTRYVTAQG